MAEKLRRGESLTGVIRAFMQFFKKKKAPAGGLQLWEPRFNVRVGLNCTKIVRDERRVFPSFAPAFLIHYCSKEHKNSYEQS